MKKNSDYIDFILAIVKYVFGILTSSIALFSEGMFNISILLKSITVSYSKDKKDSKWRNIYNIIIGTLIVIIGFSILLNIFTTDIEKVKWYMVIICILSILIFNIKNSVIYTINYEKSNREIIKTYRNYMASMIMSYIVLIGYILTLFKKYVSILKYADVFVGGIISVYIIYIGLKYILINFNGIKEDEINEEDIKNIISRNSIINSINNIEILKYGSNYKLLLNISIDKISDRVKVYPALLDLCSAIFKLNKNIELISIVKSPLVEKKRVVKSARNSRSRNSKKNATKKNTTKKNKKR